MPTRIGHNALTEGTNASSVTLNKPAGVAEGDLLVVAVFHRTASATAPSGWTLLQNPSVSDGGITQRLPVWVKTAGPSEPSSYTFSFSGTSSRQGGVIVAYRDAAVVGSGGSDGLVSGREASHDTDTFSISPAVSDGIALHFASDIYASGSSPGGWGKSGAFSLTTGSWDFRFYAAEESGVSESSSFTASGMSHSFSGAGTHAWNSAAVVLGVGNQAPSAPTLQYPTGNVMLDRTVSNQFDMGAFSDPDAGDSLSAYDLRYAPRSTTSWTTVSGGATRYHTFAGGTFAAGDWDWQAQYYDAAGEPSGWSTTAQFRMGTPPGEPTIVDPINGGVIEGPNYLAEFTASGTYDGSEWRTVADSAGSPDPGTVYWSSGVVEGTGTTYTIPFATDGRYEHLQVRLRNDTFFSSWYSVRVNVNYLKQGSGSPIGYDFTTAGATGEQPPNKGAGSSGYAYSGSASGERSPVGTGSTGYTYDGTAAGEFPAKGSGLAIEYDFSGLAEGERIPEASGSTGYAYSGSAVGNAPTDGSGVAVGSYAYSGSALGRKDPEGSGVAGFVYDGEATGLIVVSGSGQASVAWIGQAAGSIEKQGSGSIGYAFAFTEATGETPPNKGTGSAGYAFTGSAVGEGKPRGSGVIAYAYSGSAVGGTVRLIFEPPTQRQAVRGDALFSRMSVPEGLSVVRTDGQYRTTPSPWLGELVGLKDGTDYFLGGHRYEVTNEVAAELQAAGYDVQSV